MSALPPEGGREVSLAWILVHLYGDAALLDKAREEIRACPKLDDYQELSKLKSRRGCSDPIVVWSSLQLPYASHPFMKLIKSGEGPKRYERN